MLVEESDDDRPYLEPLTLEILGLFWRQRKASSTLCTFTRRCLEQEIQCLWCIHAKDLRINIGAEFRSIISQQKVSQQLKPTSFPSKVWSPLKSGDLFLSGIHVEHQSWGHALREAFQRQRCGVREQVYKKSRVVTWDSLVSYGSSRF